MARDQGAYSISRRRFCGTLAGVLVAPSVAIAQAPKAVRRIGVLGAGDGQGAWPHDSEGTTAARRRGDPDQVIQ